MRTELALQTEYARQLDSRLLAQKDFYEAKVSHENALRALRHDMAGHLNTLAILNQFLLRVSNRFDGRLTTANGLPRSTKEEVGHGYGLSNIRQAAGRRGGQMEYRVWDGYFVLDVTLEVD